MYEREKAAERIAELQAKMEHEMNIINFELEEVLTEVQKKIDTEVCCVVCVGIVHYYFYVVIHILCVFIYFSCFIPLHSAPLPTDVPHHRAL